MNELADRLAAAAEEVTNEVTDLDYQALRDRVGRTSRRLGQRRALVAAFAVVVVTGAAVGGVRLLPGPHDTGPGGGPSTPPPHGSSASSDAGWLPPDATNGPLGSGALVYVSGVPGRDLVVDLVRGDYPIPV